MSLLDMHACSPERRTCRSLLFWLAIAFSCQEITCNQKLESGLLIAPNDDSLGIGYKDPSFKGGVDQYSQVH